MALTALSALAATAVFTAPAQATVFDQGISVKSRVHIGADGAVTLSGTYHCRQASPGGAIQIKATLVQDDVRLGIGAGDAVCDDQVHQWTARSKPGFDLGLHEGSAKAVAELQEIHFNGGLLPRAVDTVARDETDAWVADHR
ncbi:MULTISPECIES: DUF6299 family protein [unclassified Streptomyces]|uniref:DUF6299 family protein n=1 Tax=unclassified Streptomyces TaxID=2593676 RepID=UPI000DC760D7|nr:MULTISPECIES: DUF6299 family protein [unclassified Streptomyces]AWZ05424.1 hypothetical protein DRB89_12990 [Streptomyces sp. ICC4]AWZ16350.1 hypothetical protein DRB96_33590 [Streptomyces sp. ICC1]